MATKRQVPKIKIDFLDDNMNPGAREGNAIAETDKLCVNKLRSKFVKSDLQRNKLRDAVMGDKPDDIPKIIEEEGIKIDEIDNNGVPLIHEAAFEGRIECVKVLLDCGAKVNELDAEDWTALHAAVLGGHTELARLLIKRGADMYAETNEKYIPFHIAIEKRDENMITLLVDEMSQLTTYSGRG